MVQKDVQRTNDKVEALSRAKEDGFKGRNCSDHSGSSRSSREERHERHEKNMKEERRERCERHERIGEDRRHKLGISKCKIPSFLGNCKPEVYIDLELKVKQMITRTKSVEEYHKEMEMDLLRAQLRESEEATIARFSYGLNREI
ncbi:hypothetical protein CR513_02303, partial [Mucuna pruriens]